MAVEKITPDQIPDIVEFTVHKFKKYNPRSDVSHSSWFRLDRMWAQESMMKVSRWAYAGYWPVVLGVLEGPNEGQGRFNIKWWARCLKTKSRSIKAAFAEFHNVGMLVVRNVEDTPRPNTNERTNETNDRLPCDVEHFSLKASPSVRPKGPNPSLLVDVWNENRGPLPAVEKLTKARAAKIKSRLKEEPDLTYWERVVTEVASTAFLRGENDRGWRASFDWLVRNEENHTKVMEGAYKGKGDEDEDDDMAALDRRYAALAKESEWMPS